MAFDHRTSPRLDIVAGNRCTELRAGGIDCSYCPAHTLCLIRGSDEDFMARWQRMVRPGPSLKQPGATLFETGTVADTVYFVRSGCLKSTTIDRNGCERVRSFLLPGDIAGLDAFDTGQHHAAAIAVTPSQVCALPAQGVFTLMERSPLLMRRLTQRLSHTLAETQAFSGEYTAEERVAAFLLYMQARLPTPSGAVQLPMTRRDIANYLRLATETVSRVLTRFAGRGAVVSERQRIHILDRDWLFALAAPLGEPIVGCQWQPPARHMARAS